MYNMTKKTKRPYKKITPQTMAIHQARQVTQGNGTRAVEAFEPEYDAPHQRAYRIVKKSEEVDSLTYINNTMEQIASEAMQELGELIHSPDEKVRGVNVRYAIDHVKGKAVAKTISLTGKVNIQSVLD